MKQFYTFCILVCLMAFVGTASAETQESHDTVKTEQVTPDALSVSIYSLDYISEATLEVIPNYAPKAIGKTTAGYKRSVIRPPGIPHYMFAYSKRL